MFRTLLLSLLLSFMSISTASAESITLSAAKADVLMLQKMRQEAEASLARLRLGQPDVIFYELPRFQRLVDDGKFTLESLKTTQLEIYRLYQILPPGKQSLAQEMRWGDDRTRAEDSLKRIRSGKFLTPRMKFDDELFDFEVWLERGQLTPEELGTSVAEIVGLRKAYYCQEALQGLGRFLSTVPSPDERWRIKKLLEEHGPCAIPIVG